MTATTSDRQSTFALTTAGIVFVIATGIYTLAAAELQYVGVRRIRA